MHIFFTFLTLSFFQRFILLFFSNIYTEHGHYLHYYLEIKKILLHLSDKVCATDTMILLLIIIWIYILSFTYIYMYVINLNFVKSIIFTVIANAVKIN